MSLIQEALEKTNRVAAPQVPPVPSKPPVVDPMGVHLEKELTRVQEDYARRRALYRKWILTAILFLCVAGVLFFYGNSAMKQKAGSVKQTFAAPSPVVVVTRPTVVAQKFSPQSISFQLTGITDLGTKKVALINEQIVGVGDSLFGEAVVKKIENQSVVLDVHGKEVRLEL